MISEERIKKIIMVDESTIADEEALHKWIPIKLEGFFLFLREDGQGITFCTGGSNDTAIRVYAVSDFLYKMKKGEIDMEKLTKESMEEYLKENPNITTVSK